MKDSKNKSKEEIQTKIIFYFCFATRKRPFFNENNPDKFKEKAIEYTLNVEEFILICFV